MKSISSIIGFLSVLVSVPVSGTEALPDIDSATIQGDWVAVDYEDPTVFLLRIEGSRATVVVTSGARKTEYLFRSDNVTVNKGAISFLGTDGAIGLKIHFSGNGRATSQRGVLEGSLNVLGPKAPFRADSRRCIYYKGNGRERLEELLKTNARAQALAGGTELRVEDQPAQRPAGPQPSRR